MNLFASSGGLLVRANLMLAVTGEVEASMQQKLSQREERFSKYVSKY